MGKGLQDLEGMSTIDCTRHINLGIREQWGRARVACAGAVG